MRQWLIVILIILLVIELPLFMWITWQIRRLKVQLEHHAPEVWSKFANLQGLPGKANGDRQMLELVAAADKDVSLPSELRKFADRLLARRKLLTSLNIAVLVTCALLIAQLYLFGA